MIPPQELILEACLETPEEAHSAFLNGAHRVEPVSYTHLTLPTISRV